MSLKGEHLKSLVKYTSMATVLKPTAPPKCLLKPLIVQRKTLMTPGPGNCPPRVLHAQTLPIMDELDSDFLQVKGFFKRSDEFIPNMR